MNGFDFIFKAGWFGLIVSVNVTDQKDQTNKNDTNKHKFWSDESGYCEE